MPASQQQQLSAAPEGQPLGSSCWPPRVAGAPAVARISDDSRIVLYFGRNGSFPSATRIALTLDEAGLAARRRCSTAASPRDAGRADTTAAVASVNQQAEHPADKASSSTPSSSSRWQQPAHTLVDGRAGFSTPASTRLRQERDIPGAVSIPFTQIIDSELMLDRTRIEGLFRAAGVKPGDTVVAYCHIGQQGTAVVFGARLLGHPVVLYDGSMQDWGSNNRGAVVK